MCKRKGRRRAQEVLERRLGNVGMVPISDRQINKRLNEDKEVPNEDLPLHTAAHFEETKSIRVLLEPDFSMVLFVNTLVRPLPGFAPAVNRFEMKGSIVGAVGASEV